MTLTCGAVSRVLAGQQTAHAGRLLTAVADAALDGARGNSGAILAQFFQGLADSLADAHRVPGPELARAFRTADEYARAALESPQEGTILSIITAVADELQTRQAEGLTDIAILLDHALRRARTELEATRHVLEAMRKANVVDAGASGFATLLEGIVDFLQHGSIRDVPEPEQQDPDVIASFVAEDDAGSLAYRYCTECLVSGEAIDRRRIREGLAQLGNSIVMAGSRNKLKIHVHTDQPDRVYELGARYGSVSGTKADDMRQQTRTIRRSKQQTVIVTDSAADIPDDIIDRLGIHVVPLRVHFGDRGYLDKVSLTADEFFRELARNPEPVRTSQPAPGDFRRTFEFLVSHFEHVVAITLTARLSGTCQAALAAAARVSSPGRVTVIDSHSISLGQGLIAMRAAQGAQAGMPPDSVIDAARASRSRTQCFGAVADLGFAVRGGRLRPSIKWLADRFGVRPIFRVSRDGRIMSSGIIGRRADTVQKLAAFIARRTSPAKRYRVAVGHANCADQASALREQLAAAIHDIESVAVTELGTALGAHTGPGTLVAAVQECGSR